MGRPAVEPIVREIEEAFVAHWSLLGRWPGARLVEDEGVLRFETPLRKIPYNGVIRTAIEERPEEVVARVVDAYAERHADFFWVVHPSATPPEVGETVARAGLTPVETATGMSLELDTWQPPDATAPRGLELTEVVDEDALRAYEDIVIAYWELDEADREQVSALNRYWFGPRANGHR